jgi:hypothetical protein
VWLLSVRLERLAELPSKKKFRMPRMAYGIDPSRFAPLSPAPRANARKAGQETGIAWPIVWVMVILRPKEGHNPELKA